MSLTGLPHQAGTPCTPWPRALCPVPPTGMQLRGQEGSTAPKTSYLCSSFVLLLPLPARFALGRKLRSQPPVCVGAGCGGEAPLYPPQLLVQTMGDRQGVRAGWAGRAWGQGCWGPEPDSCTHGNSCPGVSRAGERPRSQASLLSPACVGLGASLGFRFETPQAQVSALPGIKSPLLSASTPKTRPVISASQ